MRLLESEGVNLFDIQKLDTILQTPGNRQYLFVKVFYHDFIIAVVFSFSK